MTNSAHSEGHTKAPRPTKAEREARIVEIYKLMVMRVPRHDILQFVARKTEWGLKQRAVDYLIQAATTRFAKEAKFLREVELGKAIATLSDILTRSLRVQDYKTALAAQRELNELMGLYAPKRVSLTDLEGNSQKGFIALIPAGPQDRDAWSQQCLREKAERESKPSNEALRQLESQALKRRDS